MDATLAYRPSLELQQTAGSGGPDTTQVGTEVPFELRGFSLATLTLSLGALISLGSLAEVSQLTISIASYLPQVVGTQTNECFVLSVTPRGLCPIHES